MIWALILAAVALVAGGGGVAYASADALPDDTLYPVKLLVEDAQLLFADPAEDLQLHLEFAQRRLDEALRLAQEGRVEGLERAMANYEAHVQQALQLAQQVSQADPQVWALVEAQVARHQERLEALRQEMAQRGLTEAEQHMEEAQVRAREAHEWAVQAMGQRPEGMPTPPFGPMESPMPGGQGHGEGQGGMNGQGGMFGGQGDMNGNGGMGEMEGNGQGHGEGQGGMMTPPSPMPGGEGDHDQGNMTPPYPMPTATMPMPGSGSGHDGGSGGGMPGGSGSGSGMGGWGNGGGMP